MALKSFILSLCLMAFPAQSALGWASIPWVKDTKTYLIPAYDLATPELYSLSTYLLELRSNGSFRMLNVNAQLHMYDGVYMIQNSKITLVLVGYAQVVFDQNTFEPNTKTRMRFQESIKMYLNLTDGQFSANGEFVNTAKADESQFQLTIDSSGRQSTSERRIFLRQGNIDQYLRKEISQAQQKSNEPKVIKARQEPAS